MSTLLLNNETSSRRNGKKDDKKGLSLKEKVAQNYYKHGLFLSSYPTCSISIAIAVILICCYPLLHIPLPGTIPTKVILPYVPDQQHDKSENVVFTQETINTTFSTSYSSNNIFQFYNLTLEPPFPWARDEPFIYVQQIVLRSTIIPWNDKILLSDSFRGPLYEVFKLIEIINNHEDARETTLSKICLHIENVKRSSQRQVFPEYNCLTLSPANFWQQNALEFNKDPNILNTIFQHHNFQKTKISNAEMLLGMTLKHTGIKRYPMRLRPRIIQYAVTLVLRENDQEYINSLKERLYKIYPLHQLDNNSNIGNNHDAPSITSTPPSTITYIYYPGEFNILEFMPLSAAFITLFIYVYFSVRKIDIIKSRLILAFTSVLTVLGSLVMSLGLCFFFGLTIIMQSKGIYPYLLILVGLENVLVITKSVVSTDNNLDIKIRVAQGLSKEGWSITKNLFTEITILTVGLATFVPLIQEFCIFAIIGLLSDFFLQMLLFSTVLAFDIKRIEFSVDVVNNSMNNKAPKQYLINNYINNNNTAKYLNINRSKSHPKLDLLVNSATTNSNNKVLTTNNINNSNHSHNKKIPKRLRIVNFWARTRFFQRGFMIWMILWIGNIIYNSGIIEDILDYNNNDSSTLNSGNIHTNSHAQQDHINSEKHNNMLNVKKDTLNNENLNLFNEEHDKRSIDGNGLFGDSNEEKHYYPNGGVLKNPIIADLNITEQINKLMYCSYNDVNLFLSNFHWSAILKQYNISLSGRYVTILPQIKLSHSLDIEHVMKLRNPNDKNNIQIKTNNFKWQALAVALDPLDFNDFDFESQNKFNTKQQPIPLYPKTPMEILLIAILCSVSVFVLAYTMVVLYRCICSRNYAEWRASWNDSEVNDKSLDQQVPEHVIDSVPIQVNGHRHHIECLVTDGQMIASSCLQGYIKIWDATSGELISEIDRLKYFKTTASHDNLTTNEISNNDNNYHQQSPNNDNNMKKIDSLKNKIQFNFSSSHNSNNPHLNDFDFQYRKYFSNSNNNLHNLIQNNHVDFDDINNDMNFRRRRKSSQYSAGSSTDLTVSDVQRSQSLKSQNSQEERIHSSSPIWCLDFLDNLIVIGCADGRLEFWEGTTGNIKCIYETVMTHNNGVTNIKLAGDKVIVTRLSGRIEFLKLETYTQGRHIDWGFTSAYRRTHIRTGSAGSLSAIHNSGSPTTNSVPFSEELRCILEFQHNGHQQPINCLDVFSSTVLTGSQDHTLKVYNLENNSLLYTLHGHCGPITSLFIDQWQNGTAGSGSQDGLLCVWDLITGACMYKIQAHDDSIVSLACSPSYVISLGLDERMRIWERFQGHLLNTINVVHPYSSLLLLTSSLLVTGKPGSLIVWDIRTGEPIREVKLDCSNLQLCPKTMLPACGSVICDYGNQLRIVRFPMVKADKRD